MRRAFPFLLLSTLLCAAAAPVRAETPIRVLEADASGYSPAGSVSVVPTADGFALAWWDYRRWGEPGCEEGCARFARYDAAGRRLGAEHGLDVTTSFPFVPEILDLEALRRGYVLFVQNDALYVHSVAIDADGRQRAPSARVVESDELYKVSFAANETAIVLTFPEWWGNWIVRERTIGDDGLPIGDRRAIEAAPTGGYALVSDAPVARRAGGFACVWFREGFGIRTRELNGRGVPTGDARTLDATLDDVVEIAVATDGKTLWIPFARGSWRDTDLYLLTVNDRGEVSSPALLAGTDRFEGHDYWYEIARPIRAVAADDRAGILYLDVGPYPYRDLRWWFVEVDAAGAPIAPARDLGAEIGLEGLWYDELSLRWDEARGRYLVAWSGFGPEGAGAYVVWLDPAPGD